MPSFGRIRRQSDSGSWLRVKGSPSKRLMRVSSVASPRHRPRSMSRSQERRDPSRTKPRRAPNSSQKGIWASRRRETVSRKKNSRGSRFFMVRNYHVPFMISTVKRGWEPCQFEHLKQWTSKIQLKHSENSRGSRFFMVRNYHVPFMISTGKRGWEPCQFEHLKQWTSKIQLKHSENLGGPAVCDINREVPSNT